MFTSADQEAYVDSEVDLAEAAEEEEKVELAAEEYSYAEVEAEGSALFNFF